MRRHRSFSFRSLPTAAALIVALAAHHGAIADPTTSLPISGMPVSQFTWLDEATVQFMQVRGITAGVVGIMRDDRIVYLRGFGTDFDDNNLPENTPMRLASISKPVTAAAIQRMIDQGQLSLGDRVLSLNEPGSGILSIPAWPFPNLYGDPRFNEITVGFLLTHRGGWDENDAGADFAFQDITCSQEMGLPGAPSRLDKLRWNLGKPLQFTPGTETRYANLNYHFLHEIVEQVSGMPLETYIRTHILTPAMEVPVTEIFPGRSQRFGQNPREPRYSSSSTAQLVFFPNTPIIVPAPYGGWHHEAMTGFGGFVATAASMLEFANRYRIDVFTLTTGWTLTNAPLPVNQGLTFNGSLRGTNTSLYQINHSTAGNIRVFVGFNRRYEGSGPSTHWAQQHLNNILPTILSPNQTWPTARADGFWTNPVVGSVSGVGGYNRPFNGVGQMVSQTTAGSRVRMFPGISNWTGVINHAMTIDAPNGAALIGQQ